MEITTEIIKKLRDKTGAGMMDCKRALEATKGNMDEAVEYLRKKGAAVASKRADRSAKEGMIVTRVKGNRGVIVEVNSETDFVGRSDDFMAFANAIADVLETKSPANLDELGALTTASGKTVAQLTNDLLAKVGEKIDIRRFDVVVSNDGALSGYTHLGNKIGVLVEMTGLPAADASTGVGRDVALQVAAMNPLVIAREQVDKSLIEKELEVYRVQAANEKKPAAIVEKIATGKLEKYFQEVCLLEQTFIKDQGKTIKDVLADASAKSGSTVGIKRMIRYHLGEEGK